MKISRITVLAASAPLDGDSQVVNVGNRHQDQAIDVAIGLEDKNFVGQVKASEVNRTCIKAQRDFGS